ncbi:hypothetical protein HUT05_07015 [Streptomyces chartreusis]|uniref:Xaa-Pro dipeptidyl-peptidase-like domain-containing protein n=1 Tax=Streptomyces chartreusis TaxID=1969 RepID=A0A7H8T0U2_STRCX|nr:hypothetical protein HUT05_07015 [Streptomyces chartreusis]
MRILIETDILVPGYDGTLLGASARCPDGTDPAPVLLARSPYGKDDVRFLAGDISADMPALVAAGYALVHQSCRGTFRSEDTFTPHVDEAADGATAVAWLREQPGATAWWAC